MELFRKLTAREEETFRTWARENYVPYEEIDGLWHPVIQDECVRMNREADFGEFFPGARR
jgi:hypothetical protein